MDDGWVAVFYTVPGACRDLQPSQNDDNYSLDAMKYYLKDKDRYTSPGFVGRKDLDLVDNGNEENTKKVNDWTNL